MSESNERKEYQNSSLLLFPERGFHLHAMVKSGGRELTRNHSYSWDGTKRGDRDMVIWQYTVSGCGAVDYASRTLKLDAGKAFLLTIPERHRYYLPESSSYWEFIYLSFNGSEIMRLTAELRRLAGAVSTQYAGAETVELANRIVDSVLSGDLTPHQASSFAYEFFTRMLSDCEKARMGNLRDFHQIMHDYCLKNIERHPDIEELAAVSGFSRGHFYRKFKESIGRSPHEFILDLKMRFAMRKLQTEYNISVKEVAAACGFDDPSYFCKAFKRRFGVTPASFRGNKK
ncbi:MAG: AraC family transcriptional regulator [Lentisphaeria bacterium]|nr:AraC family transcriptional regulator [Lentisphaeria bacterium]MBO5991730.1 AraC family transcriptional regulator [Lentisphaeria bacterium]